MNRLKAAIGAAVGFTVGVLTLRTVRDRRTTPREEAAAATKDALEEASTAAEHAAAAVGHARVAGEKAAESVRAERSTTHFTGETEAETTVPRAQRRLRRVGKGWIRR